MYFDTDRHLYFLFRSTISHRRLPLFKFLQRNKRIPLPSEGLAIYLCNYRLCPHEVFKISFGVYVDCFFMFSVWILKNWLEDGFRSPSFVRQSAKFFTVSRSVSCEFHTCHRLRVNSVNKLGTMRPPSGSSSSQRSADIRSPRGRGRGIGRGGVVGDNPARPFPFGQPATIRPTNLLGNRTPRQSASAGTLVGSNGSHCYVPQPPVIPPPNVDVTPMEEQQQGHVEWTADELYGMLNENEVNVDEVVPDSQHVGDGDENVDRDTSRVPMADTDYENASGQEGWTPETVQRRQRPILRGGSSTGGRNDEDTPIDDVRPFIVPAGDDSFDPSACVKRIGMECIGPYFKVGWTTMETCDRDAPEIWFDHFKTIVRWEPIHTSD